MSEGGKVIVIKKKPKGHGHHGGAWKVAYADFVTAMMALFIVLWLLTQTDQSSREEIAEYFRTGTLPGGSLTIGRPAGSNPPLPVDILEGKGASGFAALRRLKGSVEKLLAKSARDPQLAKIAKNVTVMVSEQGALIELVDSSDDLLFAVSSSELKPAVVKFLQQLGPLLGETGASLEVHGHTDARRYKESKKTNWDLSYERADSARRVLEQSGVKHGKINGVLAHADTQPYVAADPYAPQNRRLSILVLRDSMPVDAEAQQPEPSATEAEPPRDLILEPGALKREAERQRKLGGAQHEAPAPAREAGTDQEP